LAAEALGVVGGAGAILALKQTLLGRDLVMRRAAAEALARIGSPAVPELCDLLRRPDWDVRARAALALGVIADPRASLPLSRRMLEDEHELVRVRSARALVRLGPPDPVDPLLQALHDSGSAVRCAAAEALSGARDRRAIPALVQLLLPGEAVETRKAVAGALDALGWNPESGEPAARVVYHLTRYGGLPDGDPGEWAIAPLVACLRSPDPLLRERAARALQTLAATRSVPELASALPLLRRILRSQGREAGSGPLGAAISAIQLRLARAHDLPLPSVSPAPAPQDLPRPAPVSRFDSRTLPRPGVEPTPRPRTAWQRLRSALLRCLGIGA
jgi:HEAT repeat protein